MSDIPHNYESIFVRYLLQATERGGFKWRALAAHGMFITSVAGTSLTVTTRHLTDQASRIKADLVQTSKDVERRKDGAWLEAAIKGFVSLARATGAVMYLAKTTGEVFAIESPEVDELLELLTKRFNCLSAFDEEVAHRGAKQALFADMISELGWTTDSVRHVAAVD